MDELGYELCLSHDEPFLGGQLKFLRCVRPIVGRYVMFLMGDIGELYLAICELQVFGYRGKFGSQMADGLMY